MAALPSSSHEQMELISQNIHFPNPNQRIRKPSPPQAVQEEGYSLNKISKDNHRQTVNLTDSILESMKCI